MRLTEVRKGEIALKLLKHRLKNEGIRLKPDMLRQIRNEGKEIGVSPEEAQIFTEEIVREMVEEIFPPKSETHVNLDNT